MIFSKSNLVLLQILGGLRMSPLRSSYLLDDSIAISLWLTFLLGHITHHFIITSLSLLPLVHCLTTPSPSFICSIVLCLLLGVHHIVYVPQCLHCHCQVLHESCVFSRLLFHHTFVSRAQQRFIILMMASNLRYVFCLCLSFVFIFSLCLFGRFVGGIICVCQVQGGFLFCCFCWALH